VSLAHNWELSLQYVLGELCKQGEQDDYGEQDDCGAQAPGRTSSGTAEHFDGDSVLGGKRKSTKSEEPPSKCMKTSEREQTQSVDHNADSPTEEEEAEDKCIKGRWAESRSAHGAMPSAPTQGNSVEFEHNVKSPNLSDSGGSEHGASAMVVLPAIGDAIEAWGPDDNQCCQQQWQQSVLAARS